MKIITRKMTLLDDLDWSIKLVNKRVIRIKSKVLGLLANCM